MYKECCALRSIILVYPSPALVWTYWCVAVLYSYINTHVFCTVYCRNILITVDHWHKIRNNSTTVNADNINHHLNYFTPSPIHPSLCHPAPSVDWNPNLNLWFVVRAWSDPESHSGWGRDRTLVPDCTVLDTWNVDSLASSCIIRWFEALVRARWERGVGAGVGWTL